jgi:hypothetical protein
MPANRFIKSDLKSRSELEQILFHLFINEVTEYEKTRSKAKTATIIFSVITGIVSIILFKIIQNEVDAPLIIIFVIILLGVIFGSIYFLNDFLRTKLQLAIENIGIVYLPVSQYKFMNKSILIDRSGLIDQTEFNFTTIPDEGIIAINKKFNELKHLTQNIPVVLSTESSKEILRQSERYKKENLRLYHEEANLSNLLIDLLTEFKKSQEFIEILPVFNNNDTFLSYLVKSDFAPKGLVLESVMNGIILAQIGNIDGVVDNYFSGENKAPIDIDDLSIDIIKFLNSCFPRIDFVVNNSLDKISKPASFLFTSTINNSSYNCYCPYCNSQGIQRVENNKYYHDGNKESKFLMIQNTKMRLVDLENNIWRCPLCEKETEKPFMKHKLEDELFTPLYDKLYEEHFKDRLAIYNHINDEKRKYTERADTELHNVIRENRTKVDSCKSSIRSIVSNINGDRAAIDSLNGLLRKYQRISMDVARKVEEDLVNIKKEVAILNMESNNRIDKAVDDAKKNITLSTEKYAKVEREDQSKRDEISRQNAANMKSIASNIRSLREIEEVRAEREGMNDHPYWIFDSDREKAGKNIK